MNSGTIDLSSLRKALGQLEEALAFWQSRPDGDPLKPHLRTAVIQSFEFTYELSIRGLRRVLIERAATTDNVSDLSFQTLMRKAADAGLIDDPVAWRAWREMRNITSHTYNESLAAEVAKGAAQFVPTVRGLLDQLARGED